MQRNWAFVVAYRQAPKLMAEFTESPKQFSRLIQLVKYADEKGIPLGVSDGRHHNSGQAKLTSKMEEAMKEMNKANLKRKVWTTRRRMQATLRKKGITLGLGTIHRYIRALKGRLATWHMNVSVTEEQMVKTMDNVAAQVVPGTECTTAVHFSTTSPPPNAPP